MNSEIERLTSALAGRYAVERELGKGGMATVYLAQDERHGRPVALKVLHPEVASSIGSDRFLAEIRTTAKLSHPNILPLFDSGDAGGLLFYVMPLVTGESLRSRLDREPVMDVDEAVRLTREVADALAYAHDNGTVHRDIKPENILLQSGHALVTDFGIAWSRATARDERMTQIGVSLGTPAYMSPEQAAGDPSVDTRTDIYSLACVLFEMITGSPAFTGPTVESILVARFTQPPPRVSSRRTQIPRHIDTALFCAMARDRDERFPTMARFLAALTAPAVAPVDNERSVAVLPFTSMSPDPENEYFGEGIAEDLINALAQVPGLRVAARSSTFSFKGKAEDLRAIGEKLRVRAILEGSVRRAGNRVRITAELVNAADGYQLWSERYDRELTDIFAIQDEIARTIAARLRVTLGDSGAHTIVKAPTANLPAYEAYLKARSLMTERGSVLLQVIELLEEAVKLDPEFTHAHAYLAHALVLAGFWGVLRPDRMRVRAAAAAATAVRQNANLVAAHTATALVEICINFDRDAATAAWNRAVDLDPADSEARLMRAAFDLCYVRGDAEAAMRETKLAVEIDPFSAYARAQLAVVYSFSSRPDEAVVEARRARELAPNSFFAVWALVNALVPVTNVDDYLELMSGLLPKYGRHPWFLMATVIVCARAGRQEVASALYAELMARSMSEYVQPTILAIAAEHSGDREAAFAHLRTAVETRDPVLAAFALQSLVIGRMRADSRFSQLLGSLGW